MEREEIFEEVRNNWVRTKTSFLKNEIARLRKANKEYKFKLQALEELLRKRNFRHPHDVYEDSFLYDEYAKLYEYAKDWGILDD